MRRSMLGCLLLTTLACGRGVEPQPLDVAIEASGAAAAIGEVVTFVVNARGGRLVGITIDYDDGVVEQFAVNSARTARRTFEHAFAAAGTYQVRATAVDALDGSKEASVEVRIQ